MHWADFAASRLAQRADTHTIATGITPSGHIHVGNMREVLTGDILRRACSDAGMNAELAYIADTADPLRKVYDFLDDSYSQYIGHPLGDIPAPDEKGRPDGDGTYADYFLAPFLAALEETGVECRVIDNYQSYKNGDFAENARKLCDAAGQVREIIERVSSRELSDNWFPYNPRGSDGSMDGVVITNWQWPFVHWVDQHGIEGKADLRTADGKLPWRLDWPARWQQIGVTCEPFGKDHAAAGSSYDTGKEIAKLLDYEAPMGLPYEWISLKGQGAMSSSKGITLSARQLLDIVPPEMMRYLIARTKPKRAIDFDTGEGLISMADEFERLGNSIPSLLEILQSEETMKKRKRDQIEDALAFWKYSQVVAGDSTASGSGVSFSHLSLVAQVKQDDAEVWKSLHQTHGIDEKQPSKVLQERLWRMRNWLAGELFPDSSRVSIQENINTEWVNSLSGDQIAYLQKLSESTTVLENTESAINQWIRNAAQDCKLEMKVAFNTLYNLYLGKDKGPKLAALLSALGKEQLISPLTSTLNHLG